MSEWQPIETAPRDGTRVLVYFARGGTMGLAYYSESAVDGFNWFDDADDAACGHPTYWMPLPEPPK